MVTAGEVARMLRKYQAWADKVLDGAEGINYLNGDSDQYRGSGWNKLRRLHGEARKVVASID